jgi:DNA polymerase-3 subunit delta
MYKNEFEKALNSNQLFSSYLFYGESDYLVNYYTELLSLKHSTSKEDITKIYFNDYKFDYCKQVISQLGLFGGNNVLVIKTDKKIPKKELDFLIKQCKDMDNSFLIVCGYGDKTFTTMAKSFTKKTDSAVVRLFDPYPNEIATILKNEAIKKKLNIDIPELMHLYNTHKQNLTNTVNDLDKLSVYSEQQISTSMIDLYCFGSSALNLEDFIYDLLNGKNIIDDIELLEEDGAEPITVINQITSTLTGLFNFNSFIKLNGFVDSKAILGYKLPKNIEEKRARLSIKITPKNYNRIFDILFDAELKLKTDSKIDKKSLFIATLLKISSSI